LCQITSTTCRNKCFRLLSGYVSLLKGLSGHG
jgi:hypothetical protein